MADGDNNGNGNGLSASGRWQWFLSIITAVAIVIGSLMTFFIQSANLATIVSIDSQRILILETQQRDGSERAAATRADIAGLRASLKEIDTKVCSSDIVRNLIYSSQMRIFSMLWQKLHEGETLPTDNTFYPNICPKD